MKKKLIAIIAMVCVAAFVLSACGGGNTPSGSGSAAPQSGGSAKTYDVGVFTVDLPAGWKEFPQKNVFGEKDENGEYPINQECIYVSKDAETELDLFSKPYVSFQYYKPESTLLSPKSMYDDVKDLDVKIDGAEVTEAFQGSSSLGSTWEFQIITLKYENGQFVVTIPVSIDGKDTGLKWDAQEVLSMINSLKIK